MTDFPQTWHDAKTRFCSGVILNGGQIESVALNAKDPEGEDLTIDIGWFGSSQPKRAFIHSSGLQGVDGFAGSAIQLQWLEETGIGILPPDDAIVIVHVRNPYGMAWAKRSADPEAARRFGIYISGRLSGADRLTAIDVRTGPGSFGDDRLVRDADIGWLSMFPNARVDFAVQQFGSCSKAAELVGLGNYNPKNRKWQQQILESGKEVIEDSLRHLFE